MKKVKCPDLSETLYRAIWEKLEPDDFDKNNPTDLKLLEWLGWFDEEGVTEK